MSQHTMACDVLQHLSTAGLNCKALELALRQYESSDLAMALTRKVKDDVDHLAHLKAKRYTLSDSTSGCLHNWQSG